MKKVETCSSGQIPCAAFLLAMLAGCAANHGGDTGLLLGAETALGSGVVQSFAELRPGAALHALGMTLSERSLDGLPSALDLTFANRLEPCLDLDGDESFDVRSECVTHWALDLPLPSSLAEFSDVPVRWASLTWYPQGHRLPGVYNLPHFDLRFHLASREAADKIRSGPCGVIIHCDDYEVATIPVPPEYTPEDYVDVGAALPGLGNHLIDARRADIDDPNVRLSRAFVYGAYEGRLTFLQIAVTREYLAGRPNECVPIKQPPGWQVGGDYPTSYCVRYMVESAGFRLSLEGFVTRRAEGPRGDR